MLALRRLALPARRLTRGLALPPHTVVGLPALSPTMMQGNIAKYVANVGDELAVGDRLAEIETDKATVDFEMADDGVLAKILLPEGASDIPVGTPMVVLVDDVAHVAAFADFTVDAAPAAPAAAPAPAAAATPAPASVAGVSMPATSGRVYWNPEKGWFRA
jgi:pyruvate dehydrogenase E2 component (dihydrolipoamide acetyltransferase)